jgi:hypothetical protein
VGLTRFANPDVPSRPRPSETHRLPGYVAQTQLEHVGTPSR